MRRLLRPSKVVSSGINRLYLLISIVIDLFRFSSQSCSLSATFLMYWETLLRFAQVAQRGKDCDFSCQVVGSLVRGTIKKLF